VDGRRSVDIRMRAKKKICFVIPSLTAGGGSERVITELANYCGDHTAIDTHLIILAKVEKFYSVSANVTIHEPDFDYKKYSRLIFTLKIMLFLRKKISALKPDAVLSFEEMYSSFVLLSTLFLKYRIFVSDRSKPDKDWGILHNSLRKILYRFAYGIVSQTTYSRNFLLKETGNKNIKVISNPIKKVVFGNSVEKENIVLNVGRFIRSKNQDLLMELFAKTNDYRKWKLVFAGDGPERQYLMEIRDKLGLQKNVIFTGNVGNVGDYYQKSKIFAFTSVSEGFPNALGEAMSSGLPCISFDCVAGPSDLVDNGINGYLINEGDTESYLKRLNELMMNEQLCSTIGAAAQQKMESFTLDIIAPQYINFLLNESKENS